jgi:excisionase family DNA binding protein
MRTSISLSSSVLTMPEVMGWLGISSSTLYRLCRQNEIPHFRLGKYYRFNREQIAGWIEKRETQPISTALVR